MWRARGARCKGTLPPPGRGQNCARGEDWSEDRCLLVLAEDIRRIRRSPPLPPLLSAAPPLPIHTCVLPLPIHTCLPPDSPVHRRHDKDRPAIVDEASCHAVHAAHRKYGGRITACI